MLLPRASFVPGIELQGVLCSQASHMDKSICTGIRYGNVHDYLAVYAHTVGRMLLNSSIASCTHIYLKKESMRLRPVYAVIIFLEKAIFTFLIRIGVIECLCILRFV